MLHFIYPIPASSEVTFSTIEPTSLQIMGVYGKVLKRQDILKGRTS
ncbi:MAG TPA: hypothetical protein VK169_00710 [Saprospiraceae bacterium]|nr:hypothetical protein [Saprospiraceae bacterium]